MVSFGDIQVLPRRARVSTVLNLTGGRLAPALEMVVLLSVTVTGKVLVTAIRFTLERLFPCRSTPVDLEFLGDRKDCAAGWERAAL